ncbi:MAG: ABC transporter permease, partial [Rhodobacteraceae bacterium]|nr:ABC transporter permease [Paracoccaceae bacterium]
MSSSQDYEKAVSDASNEVADFDDHRKGFVGRLQHALHVTPALVPLIVLVFAIALFGILLGSKFFSPFALTLIILTAGIDLSVGAIAVFCTVIMGQFSFRYGIPAPMSVALGLAVGTGLGAISGWLVSRVKLPPFIVTLGMWQIVLAANYLYSANETLRSQDIAEQAAFLQFLGTKIKFGGATFTFGVVLMVAL